MIFLAAAENWRRFWLFHLGKLISCMQNGCFTETYSLGSYFISYSCLIRVRIYVLSRILGVEKCKSVHNQMRCAQPYFAHNELSIWFCTRKILHKLGGSMERAQGGGWDNVLSFWAYSKIE